MNTTSFEKNKLKFLLLEGVHPSAVKTINAAGYTNIELLSKSLSEKDLIEKLPNFHFLGIRSRTQLTPPVFEAASKLSAVGCFCIGTNQVNLDAAMMKGVPVFNAPYSNTRSVAELILAEVIFLLRGIPEKNASAHRGGWLKSANNSFEARGKTLGIVGYGNIGTQLGVLAESLGMKVQFYDVVTKLPIGNAAPASSLQDLLNTSDAVTFHVPETPSTKEMMGAAQFSSMKPGAVFLNASRGTVVVIEALAAAIKSKHLAGAAIDVFPIEPESNEERFESPLRGFDNVILTPHVGGSTLEAQENIGIEVAEKLVRYSDTGTTLSAVNFPEVSLPRTPGKNRLLHIHRNVPGVLSEINQVFSENNINIGGQYLQTNAKVGYVVIDVDQEYSELAVKKLLEVKGTIRCRALF
jgi:D-3-phosphoglycerate dehydrogenase / 2-oxoglutarate reductase